jgi:diguanylate cyclase (GGDEF)-like protein
VLSVDLPVSGMRPGPVQCEVLGLFAEHAAIAILHARMHSELTRSQSFLAYAATHDQLTGLANRTYLWARVAEAAAQPVQPIGVLIVDLDGFKEVNDGAGHDAGDEVLRTVARRMRGLVGQGNLLARLGGDEFVAVLTGIAAVRALPETAERLRAAIARPITGRAGAIRVTASIGAATGTTASDFTTLMRAADAAMYRIKRTGARLP